MNFNTVSWHDGDLSAASGTSALALSNTGLSSFIASSGGISVYYVATDLHVHEMNFNLSAWGDGDVTSAGSGALAAGNGGVSSFIASSGGISVFYLANSQHLGDLNFNLSFWSFGDLSAITGGVQPATGSALTSFVQ